jgi:uncharacterized membrane protein YccC
MVARAKAVPVVTKWHWTPQDPFGDLRVRYGIKMGLAGLLALFCTQVLRLPHDNWAILTVLVLMSAQFVGSITVKAIMRVIGTIAGAFVGIWLVGDYASTPAIFLPVLFLVIALAGYKFGQVGARQLPYAYYLFGLTTLTVATDGVTDPAQAWQIGLDRSEEILVGLNLLMVLAQIKALLNGDPHREKIQTQLAMLPVEALQAARQIRTAGCSEEERNKLADLPLEAPLRVLDLVERYHASAEALEECGRLVRTLEIQRYWGDYAL